MFNVLSLTSSQKLRPAFVYRDQIDKINQFIFQSASPWWHFSGPFKKVEKRKEPPEVYLDHLTVRTGVAANIKSILLASRYFCTNHPFDLIYTLFT
jgi:hypothetical protein